MDAAKGGLAGVETLAEGTGGAVVLVAEGGEVVGGAGHAELAGVGAGSLGVFVGVEDGGVDGVGLEASSVWRRSLGCGWLLLLQLELGLGLE